MDHGEAPKLLCCNNICTIVHCCNGEALNFYLVTTYAPLSLPSHYILVLPKPSFSTKQSFFYIRLFAQFLFFCFGNSTPPIVEIMMIRKLFVFLLFRLPSPSIKYQVYQDFHLFLSKVSTLHPSEISLSVYLRFLPAYFSEDIF